jgi:PleD family two-component response regulator
MDGLREDRTARAPAREGSNDENVIPVTQTKDLVKSLHMIMEPIPKHTPLIITLDPAVPEAVVGDDLKLFRSALNLVSNACNRTLEGTVHMRIYTHQDNNNRQRQQLVFECEDTAPDIDVEEYQYLFQPSSSEDGNLRLGLSSVASLITSLDGEYGFRPRVGRRRSGSIFWFSIPLYVPDSPAAKAAMASIQQAAATAATVSSPHRSPHPSPLTIPVKLPNIPSVPSIGSLRQMGPGTAGLRRTGSTGSATGSINRTGSRDSGLFKSGSGNSIYQSRRNGSGSSSVFRRHGSNSNVLNVGVINESALNAVFDPSVLECIDPAGTSFNSCLPWSNILPRGSLSCGQEAAQVASAEDDRKMPAVERSDEEDAAAPKAPVVPEDAPAQEVFAEVHEAVAVPQVAVVGNEETSEADSKPSKPQPRKRRALVIDDSLVIRKSLCRALQKLGFEVVTAVDGLEGLKEMKKTLFDLVLCDFLMPVMDGLDCVKQYREWESQNRPRFKQLIIGISAHANVNDSGQGIKAGMDDFKAKPISIKTLEELQGTDIAVARTRQLDELEGSASRANVVDADDTKPADTKPSGEETGKRGMDNGETSLSQEAKRQKTVPAENQAIRVCLMATDTPTKQSNKVLGELESRGWKVAVVHNGNDALRVLKMRNWDVVLIDDDLPQLSGIACVTKFREWEAHNRVNGQKNLFMVCEGDIPSPSDKASVIQPPSGCNGVLRKPVPWKDLQYLIQEEIDGGHDCGMNIVVRKKKVGAAASSN